MKKSKLTTIFGAIAGAGTLLGSGCLQQNNIPIPTILVQLGPILQVAGTVGLGLAAKDWNVTGGTK